MENERLPHKLAAILYADVAGYSRLTAADEDTTHRTLREYLERINACVERHTGRVMHYAGDAVLARFDAAVDAVACAIEIQRELAVRNAGVPGERKVEFRIGVNLGDVIADRGDIYGDGVNIAARLEGVAGSGEICVSDSVRMAVGQRLPCVFEDLGEQTLKNIVQPVHAYRVLARSGGQGLDETEGARRPERHRPAWLTARTILFGAVLGAAGVLALGIWSYSTSLREPSVAVGPQPVAGTAVTAIPDTTSATDAKPSIDNSFSIAVLPFVDMSPDKDQEYFADGLTEEILNALAQSPNLRVAGRTSSFYFKGRNEDLRTIGEKLNVENILEGSVRKAGNKIKITTQFNNARTGYHYWSKTFDRDLDDIFKVQTEIAESVAGSLQISLGLACAVCPGLTRNVAAWDEFLLANKEDTNSPVGANNIIKHLETAVAIDPDFAQAWNFLGNAYLTAAAINPTNRDFQLQQANTAFEKVEKLVPNAPYVLSRKALSAISDKGWVEAEKLFKQAITTPGTETLSYNLSIANFQFRLGHVKTAIGYFEQARVSEPLDPGVSIFLALMYAYDGNFAASLAESERSNTEIGKESLITRGNAFLASMASNNHEAIALWKKRLNDTPGNVGFFAQMPELLDKPQEAVALLRQFAGSPQNNSFLSHVITAEYAAYFGENELALENLEQFTRLSTPWSTSFWLWHPIFKNVRAMPGFKNILTNLGIVDYWRTTGNWGDFCRLVGEEDLECK